MRSIGKKYFKVTECIFNRTVHVLLNYSDADYEEWIKRIGAELGHDSSYDNFSGWSVEMSIKGRQSEWIIVLKDFDWTIRDQGTLIHEIVHTVVKIWDMNHIPLDLASQEFLAHSIGNLYEDIAAKLLRIDRARSGKNGKK